MEWKYQSIERDGFRFLIAKNDTEGPEIYWLGSALYYPRVIPNSLASAYNITIVDHRGFAKRIHSTKETESIYQLETVLDDFSFFQNLLKIPPCIVLGHSGHGYMALTYAKKYPKLVTELIMVATGPSHGSPLLEREHYFETLASEERKEKHKHLQSNFAKQIEANPEGLENFFNLYCVSQDALGFYDLTVNSSELWEGVRTNKLAFDVLFGKEFVEIQVEDYFASIHVPVKLILGKYDFQVAPHYTWDSILDKFPFVNRMVIDECGHLPFYERPEEFLKMMKKDK